VRDCRLLESSDWPIDELLSVEWVFYFSYGHNPGAKLECPSESWGAHFLAHCRRLVSVRVKGSHRQFHHHHKPGTVTVAGKPSIDVPPGTLNSALKQAGLKRME
jgi:predicted RNA binding protein YcfA (HicA-like mRNA interferase family)